MKPLYLSSPVRRGLGPCLRPGGTTLTERIIELLEPDSDSMILDAGCGTGTTMTMVKQRLTGEKNIFGLDLDNGLLTEAQTAGHGVAQGDLAWLPLSTAMFDLILCECVWNLTAKEEVLAEFARILKPGGILAMSDIYARAENTSHTGLWPVRCCFSSATDLETVVRQVSSTGFTLTTLEDHTSLLNKTAADFVFAHGSLHGFWQAVTGDAQLAETACEAAAAARPGLFLLIAQRNSQ